MEEYKDIKPFKIIGENLIYCIYAIIIISYIPYILYLAIGIMIIENLNTIINYIIVIVYACSKLRKNKKLLNQIENKYVNHNINSLEIKQASENPITEPIESLAVEKNSAEPVVYTRGILQLIINSPEFKKNNKINVVYDEKHKKRKGKIGRRKKRGS
ncbi:hypothetical protein TCON_2033 [Astathelohania contejeani]|uniref:Uncharacterized protein n=1 Tax=Astathelohania contejeani TaxID=164912 RepID=A0ABQ7HXA0_9MICR|nr:hypothetical protein TCON_2033 [Thelohania contejeani]